jgi:2-phosphosulfolactate phosphatase
MGLDARVPALEDDEAALWLVALLEGRRPDFTPVRARILACDGAQRLRRLGQTADLEACTALDSSSVVPALLPGDPARAAPLER